VETLDVQTESAAKCDKFRETKSVAGGQARGFDGGNPGGGMKILAGPMIMATGLAAALLLCGTAARAQGADENSIKPNDSAAAAYCVQTGGKVQVRKPAYGTNGGNPLILSGERHFCTWIAKDKSHIWVLLSTLVTPQPTLAALAYYAQVPYQGGNGNPGSIYCSQLGGTDLFGGINAAGGGWVLKFDHPDVLETCIFPDESSIDSFGLFYHSANIIRGIDLSTVLKYQNPYAKAN
jgi:putative hemolysin